MDQMHLNFGCAESESLADLYSIDLDSKSHDGNSPFPNIDLDNEEQAGILGEGKPPII